MDLKRFFLEELKKRVSDRISNAGQAEVSASGDAAPGEGDGPRAADAKALAHAARLASGYRRRRKQYVAEMERLLELGEQGLRRFRPTDRVGIGALVDVRIEDEAGSEERTLFVLPAGAGVELEGPGGDGYVVVVTPNSPVGKALVGARVDDSFEIVVDGRDREWTVLDVG